MNGSILLSKPEIAAQILRLRADFKLTPVTASEIEFYLHGAEDCAALPAFWNAVLAACAVADIAIFNHGKETGREQFEIALAPVADAEITARDTLALKNIISEASLKHRMRADFAAKPLADQPGSGLHIHVHLTDENGKNTFYKDDVAISSSLQYAIGGLLATMRENMPVFAPVRESYARFVPGGNAPLTVSWGANNRTVAIRLPQAAHANKHIEHRASGADADPQAVMAVILAGMHYGLKNRINPGPQIFGDASLEMYHLPALF